jgi:hypothetical protein
LFLALFGGWKAECICCLVLLDILKTWKYKQYGDRKKRLHLHISFHAIAQPDIKSPFAGLLALNPPSVNSTVNFLRCGRTNEISLIANAVAASSAVSLVLLSSVTGTVLPFFAGVVVCSSSSFLFLDAGSEDDELSFARRRSDTKEDISLNSSIQFGAAIQTSMSAKLKESCIF